MEIHKLRAWWWHKQGLDGSLEGRSAAEVLERAGWARSVAGVGPYLTLWSRASIGRQEADAAVARLEIHELPAARGCTYVVPQAHFLLALGAAAALGEDPELKVARKLGVTDAEIDRLCAAVERALEGGALAPEEIRARVGDAARSLGEAGKKKGLTTTLPLALGGLQARGEIRRVPVNGRLDQQRYLYTLWRPGPGPEPGEVFAQLARCFFTWIGPATLADFQDFAGIGVKAAKAAVEGLKLEPVGEMLLLPEDREEFERFAPAGEAQYALVSSLDAMLLLRGEKDLASHAILDRGQLIGLWEYDTETQTIAWKSSVGVNRELKAAVERTEAFVREELGDARSFSLDSPKSRAPRIAALRG